MRAEQETQIDSSEERGRRLTLREHAAVFFFKGDIVREKSEKSEIRKRIKVCVRGTERESISNRFSFTATRGFEAT
jgi:hypothetical protein